MPKVPLPAQHARCLRDCTRLLAWIPEVLDGVRTKTSSLQVRFSARVVNIALPSNDAAQAITVSTASAKGDLIDNAGSASVAQAAHLTCRLLVGADGYASCVRSALSSCQPDAGWKHQEARSPSGGLAWKVRERTHAWACACTCTYMCACVSKAAYRVVYELSHHSCLPGR